MQPRSYEPRALPLELPRLIAPFNVQLDNSPAVGIEPTTSEGANASPPRAYRLRHTGYTGCSSALMHRCDVKNIYRRQVSILCPRGYEPRALPLRHAGLVPPDGFDPIDLRVMSPALCL